MIDGMLLPGYRMVGAKHDLAGADLRNQMPQSLRGEHHGVGIELVQVFRGLFFSLISGLQCCGETKQAWGCRLGVRCVQHAATAERDVGCSCALQKVLRVVIGSLPGGFEASAAFSILV